MSRRTDTTTTPDITSIAMATADRLERRQSFDVVAEQVKRKFDTSHFDLNAIIRGAQLTLVGGMLQSYLLRGAPVPPLCCLRSLGTDILFLHSPTGTDESRHIHLSTLQTSRHCRSSWHSHPLGYIHTCMKFFSVAAACILVVAYSDISALKIIGIRVFLWFLSFTIDLRNATWDDKLVGGLGFVEEHVLQAPLFFMSLMRYVTPTLDDLFMDSIRWVDTTYVNKHKHDEDPSKLRPMYYPNLRQYSVRDGTTNSTSTAENISMFIYRFARKGAISLAVFAASYLPYVGRFVLPAASFWTFNRAVGLGPASVIFGTGVLLPRKYLVIFLQSYFASRSLVRELLEPYFARIRFTSEQKRKWFRSREGLLFGFGIGFYILLRVPLLGVLIYGIAEAVSYSRLKTCYCILLTRRYRALPI